MYQIRKGWPSDGAIDEVFTAAAGENIAEGKICFISNREGYEDWGTDGNGTMRIPCFVIGNEKLTGKFVGLVSNFVVECDADHYNTMPVVGNYVGVNNGKFMDVGLPDITLGENGAFTFINDKYVGRVLSADSSTGIIRVLWK